MNIRGFIQLTTDRAIERGRRGHYISPGGYEFEFADGKVFHFDFCQTCGSVTEEPNIINFELRDFDTSLRPDDMKEEDFYREFFASAHHPVTKIHEFFVYTGEYDDPEIHVSAVNSVIPELIADDGSIFKNEVSQSLLAATDIAS